MQTYLSNLSLRMEKIEKKNLFHTNFYIETVIVITNEHPIERPRSADNTLLIYRLY